MQVINVYMSKIGKKLIPIPDGIQIVIEENKVKVKKGLVESVIPVLKGVTPLKDAAGLIFQVEGKGKQMRSNWGTMRALVANAIEGVIKGFEKTLILEGVGYKVTKEGKNLVLSLGFSHPVKYEAPQGIEFEVEKNQMVKIKGANKEQVGQVAAELRALKKPEPYKGKGFRYSGEVIRRKAGKKAATGTA